MTDQERQLLEELAGRIQKAPVGPVDRDADALIRREIGGRPDALYLLTQTVLIQEMALNQAKAQIEDLKRQAPAASFLPPQTQAPQSTPGGGYRSSGYQTGYTTPPPAPQQPQYAPPVQYVVQEYAPQPSGFSGFLRNAAQTAAGIVAGEVAFSAISSMFGHHDHYYEGGGFAGGGFLGGGGNVISPVSETIINNNYYAAPEQAEYDSSDDAGSDDSGDDDSYDDSSDDSGDDNS